MAESGRLIRTGRRYFANIIFNHCKCRSCALLRRLKFSAIFLCHLVPQPSIGNEAKFYGDRPRETVDWTRSLLTALLTYNLSFKISFTVAFVVLMLGLRFTLWRNLCASLLYFVVRVRCRRKTSSRTFAISSADELLVILRKSESRNTMVTSDFSPEVEIRPFRGCAMKNMQYNPYLWLNCQNFRVF